jgi:hypothetical protein
MPVQRGVEIAGFNELHDSWVQILLRREELAKSRAITHRTIEEVAQYRAETGTDW